MRWITKSVARLCFCLILLLLCQWVSAAPWRENHSITNRRRSSREWSERSSNPFNYFAAKTMEMMFRAVSFVYQLVPNLTNFFKFSRPTCFAESSTLRNHHCRFRDKYFD